MFCSNCGKQFDRGTNFCPGCGVRVGASAAEETAANVAGGGTYDRGAAEAQTGSAWGTAASRFGGLVRPRAGRVLGGVCAGIALHFGWNRDLVRVATAVVALFYGIGILAYIACWILLPEAPYALPSQSS